jgi:hemoglobin
MANLRDRYGAAKVTRIVTAFYASVLESDRLHRHFEGADMHTLIDHQAVFLTTMMGGPESFGHAQIAAAHGSLGISGKEFDEMLRILEAKLEEFEVESADIDAVVGGYRTFRDAVVATDDGSR